MTPEGDKGFEDHLGDLWDTRLILLMMCIAENSSWWDTWLEKGDRSFLSQSSSEQVHGENLTTKGNCILEGKWRCWVTTAPDFAGVTAIEDVSIIFPSQLNNLKKSLFTCEQKVSYKESS